MKEEQKKRSQTRRKPFVKRAFRKQIGTASLEAAVSRLAKRGVLCRAARLAIEKQLSKGVPAVWMEDGVIYKQYPDGRKEKLASRKIKSRKLSRQRFIIQK